MWYSWPKSLIRFLKVTQPMTINSPGKLAMTIFLSDKEIRCWREKCWHLVGSKVMSLIDWILALLAPEWQSIVETINNFFAFSKGERKRARNCFHPSTILFKIYWFFSLALSGLMLTSSLLDRQLLSLEEIEF